MHCNRFYSHGLWLWGNMFMFLWRHPLWLCSSEHFLEKQQVNTDVSKGVRTVYLFDLTSLGHILCMSFDDHSTSSGGCIRGLIGSIELAAWEYYLLKSNYTKLSYCLIQDWKRLQTVQMLQLLYTHTLVAFPYTRWANSINLTLSVFSSL